jgi:anti-anti-sigma regulatory factor
MSPQSYEVNLVRVENAFTVETAGSVKQQLSNLLDRPGHVVLDLGEATVDSAGLGAMLSMQRFLELRGRKLLLVSNSLDFQGLLDRSGAAGSVTVFADAAAAVNAVLAGVAPVLAS